MPKTLDKLWRRWQIRAMERIDGAALARHGAARALAQFRRVSRQVPAYAAILQAHGIAPERILTPEDFVSAAPVLAKEDLFGVFPLAQLCRGGRLGEVAGVLTSSGQGGRLAFGIHTRQQLERGTKAIELALEYSFGTDHLRTLLINALPMGVRFDCTTVTLAETSVREDMVCAIVEQIGPEHDQIILVTDPLFCKRLLDEGRAKGLDWGRHKIHVVLGEETFGEAFRRYVAESLGQDAEDWTRGLTISSMGVAELGLNLFFETHETVRLRQLAARQPECWRRVIGDWPGQVPPLLLVFDPLRIFVEVIAPAANGFGSLTLSMLDQSLRLPLLRYRTGDRARLLDSQAIANLLHETGEHDLLVPRLPMIALAGRESEMLVDGRSLLDIKDALYLQPDLADHLSGAWRIEPAPSGHWLHIQRSARCPDPARSDQALADALIASLPTPPVGHPDRVKIWGYADFPYGRTLDYERKFIYQCPASPAR